MKKIFTLVAAAMMAVGVNAQKEWNFSNWTAAGYTATTTIDGLTVYAAENPNDASKPYNVVVDASKKTIDEVKYTQRIKLGGSGGFEKDESQDPVVTYWDKPKYRVLAFDVTGDCDIYVAFAHASSSGDDRTLMIAKSDGTEIGTATVSAGQITSTTIKYTGAATTVFVYSKNSGINLYDLKWTLTQTGISNITADKANANAPIYNLAGQQVSKDFKGVCIQNGKKFINK